MEWISAKLGSGLQPSPPSMPMYVPTHQNYFCHLMYSYIELTLQFVFSLFYIEMDDKDQLEDVEIEMKEGKEPDTLVIQNLDDILPYVGELGKYQMILIAIMALAILLAGFPVLIMFFAGQNPPWQCVTNSTVCTLNGTYKSGDKNYKARCSMPRSEWKFTKPKEYSIVTQVHKTVLEMFLFDMVIFFIIIIIINYQQHHFQCLSILLILLQLQH